MTAEQRVRSYFQSWFITEPILFSVVNTHVLEKNNKIKTMRVGNRRIEYNEEFINNIEEKDLKALLTFEAFRILCKHPYERKRKNPIANFTGSNVTVQEFLSTHLEMPKAKGMFEHLLKTNRSKEQEQFAGVYEDLMDLDESELEKTTGMTHAKLRAIRNQIPDFDPSDLDKRHFEFYYNLIDQNLPEVIDKSPQFEKIKKQVEDALNEQGDQGQSKPEEAEGEEQGEGQGEPSDVKDHFDPSNSFEQGENWGEDEMVANDINDAISSAQATDTWGSVPGSMQQMLIASMKPKVDYKALLRTFRATIIASATRMHRMRPNRRFGFGFPGKKREFTTRLAFFVDVSGSMDNFTLNQGFSIINRFFQYGIESVEVYQFDTEMKSDTPLTMHKAKKEIKLMGRGGTDFQCVINLLSKKAPFDGVIIYTDGYASKPRIPKGVRKDNILWLFDTERNYRACKDNLKHCGKAAYVKSDRE